MIWQVVKNTNKKKWVAPLEFAVTTASDAFTDDIIAKFLFVGEQKMLLETFKPCMSNLLTVDQLQCIGITPGFSGRDCE